MSDPRDTDPRYADLKRRLDEAPSGGGSMWPWLAGLVAVLALVGMSIGYNWTHEASDNQSNAPTTTGAAPSAPRLVPPAPFVLAKGALARCGQPDRVVMPATLAAFAKAM